MKACRGWLCIVLIVVVGAGAALAQQNDPRPGRLALIGADSNVYVIAEDGTSQALTIDAGAAGDMLRFYQWPTWSHAGALAFFGAQLSRPASVSLEMWVTQSGTAPEVVYSAEDETFTYAYWSPSRCAEGGACNSVAALIGVRGEDGFTLRQIPADGSAARALGRGSPFYFDWSPDGAQMAWHRDNGGIELANPATGAVTRTIDVLSGASAAPAWSPDGTELVYGAFEAAGAATALAVFDGTRQRVIASGLEGLISFAWSPDGRAIAYKEQSGPLVVLDAATGEEQARSENEDVMAFFWSPIDGQIAYIVPVDAQPAGSFNAKRLELPIQQPSLARLAWLVLNVEEGTSARVATFAPTREEAYFITYFDQFSLSHRVWSPDGTRIVYGEMLAADRPVVQVIDLAQPGSPPQIVAQGMVGIWSFE